MQSNQYTISSPYTLYSNSFLHYVKDYFEYNTQYYVHFLDKRFVSKNDLKLIKVAFDVATKKCIIPSVTVSDLDDYYFKIVTTGYINKFDLFKFFLSNNVIVSLNRFSMIIEEGK